MAFVLLQTLPATGTMALVGIEMLCKVPVTYSSRKRTPAIQANEYLLTSPVFSFDHDALLCLAIAVSRLGSCSPRQDRYQVAAVYTHGLGE